MFVAAISIENSYSYFVKIDHFCAEFQRKFKKDLKTNTRSMAKLREACERAKRSMRHLTLILN
jgi:hypothetical protein